jgi:hypothetical protein
VFLHRFASLPCQSGTHFQSRGLSRARHLLCRRARWCRLRTGSLVPAAGCRVWEPLKGFLLCYRWLFRTTLDKRGLFLRTSARVSRGSSVSFRRATIWSVSFYTRFLSFGDRSETLASSPKARAASSKGALLALHDHSSFSLQ